MKKIVVSVLTLLAGGMLFLSTPATADPHHGGRPPEIRHPGYNREGHGHPGYHRPGYGHFPRPGIHVYVGYEGYYVDPAADWVWDPYLGEYVAVRYYPEYGCRGFFSTQFGIVIQIH